MVEPSKPSLASSLPSRHRWCDGNESSCAGAPSRGGGPASRPVRVACAGVGGHLVSLAETLTSAGVDAVLLNGEEVRDVLTHGFAYSFAARVEVPLPQIPRAMGAMEARGWWPVPKIAGLRVACSPRSRPGRATAWMASRPCTGASNNSTSNRESARIRSGELSWVRSRGAGGALPPARGRWVDGQHAHGPNPSRARQTAKIPAWFGVHSVALAVL